MEPLSKGEQTWQAMRNEPLYGFREKRDRLADSQFIIDEDFRRLSVNCTDSLYGKSSAVFCAAAILISTVIENRRAETVTHNWICKMLVKCVFSV